MSQRLLKRAIGYLTRENLLRLLAAVVSMLLIQPAFARCNVEDRKDDERLKKAPVVLQEMLSRDVRVGRN